MNIINLEDSVIKLMNKNLEAIKVCKRLNLISENNRYMKMFNQLFSLYKQLRRNSAQ